LLSIHNINMAMLVLLSSTVCLATAFLLLAKLWTNHQWSKKYKFPPGPKGIPYFGNMFQMPPFHQGPWAKEVGEKYGEMYLKHHLPFPI
jgi:hypothetical protein